MIVMGKKKSGSNGAKVYPSRKNLKYTSLPKNLWDILDSMATEQERSVAYFVRRYVTDGLRRDNKLPPKEGDHA